MAVFRIEKTRDYTVMSNHHLRDQSLSLKAKGLLSMMLSLPEEWNYTTRGLAAICKEGTDSIGSALKELERTGYIVRNRLRDSKGKILDVEYVIYETSHPATEPDTAAPDTACPHPENPDMDIPCLEKPSQLNIDRESNYSGLVVGLGKLIIHILKLDAPGPGGIIQLAQSVRVHLPEWQGILRRAGFAVPSGLFHDPADFPLFSSSQLTLWLFWYFRLFLPFEQPRVPPFLQRFAVQWRHRNCWSDMAAPSA